MKRRASALREKLPGISGGSPFPHKGLQVIISAHSKRPPSVGEKLSPFISIHIHPYLNFNTKRKKLESDKCLQTRYLQIDFAHLAWCSE